MAKFIFIVLLAMVLPVFQEQKSDALEKPFLHLKYMHNIKTLFNEIEKDPNFKLRTSREHFMQGAEFYARYTGKSELYRDADSIIIHALTCNDMSTFFKPEVSGCKSLKVLYYLKDTSAVSANYHRLNVTIKNALILSDSTWKNHEGAARGVYFLTDKIYPFITLDKHTYKSNYLSVTYTDYGK